LPFPNGCFDIISRSVVEHLAEPEQVFQEFARVLMPGMRATLLAVFESPLADPHLKHRSLLMSGT
jgi:ubiquinone/menaquinone biosynthesis C-methylase UbiE